MTAPASISHANPTQYPLTASLAITTYKSTTSIRARELASKFPAPSQHDADIAPALCAQAAARARAHSEAESQSVFGGDGEGGGERGKNAGPSPTRKPSPLSLARSAMNVPDDWQ